MMMIFPYQFGSSHISYFHMGRGCVVDLVTCKNLEQGGQGGGRHFTSSAATIMDAESALSVLSLSLSLGSVELSSVEFSVFHLTGCKCN